METTIIKSAGHFNRLVDNDWDAARWGQAAAHVWLDILEDFPDLTHAVSLNKNLPDEILILLSKHEDRRIRSTIAMKRRLPRQVFLSLSRDPYEAIRLHIACNPKTPRDILERMQADSWGRVARRASERLRGNG